LIELDVVFHGVWRAPLIELQLLRIARLIEAMPDLQSSEEQHKVADKHGNGTSEGRTIPRPTSVVELDGFTHLVLTLQIA